MDRPAARAALAGCRRKPPCVGCASIEASSAPAAAPPRLLAPHSLARPLACGFGSQSGIMPLSAYGGRGMCAGTSSIGDTLPGRSGGGRSASSLQAAAAG